MRFTERLRGLKAWTYTTLCEGREMKAPAPNMDIGVIQRQEPTVYLGWAPARMDGREVSAGNDSLSENLTGSRQTGCAWTSTTSISRSVNPQQPSRISAAASRCIISPVTVRKRKNSGHG